MNAEFDPYHKWLVIPASEQPAHHYRLLGVALFEQDLDVIDAAANQRMAYLQDMASGPNVEDSQRILNEISTARRCLLNPEQKAQYDVALQQHIAARARPAQTAPETAAPANDSVPPGTAKISPLMIGAFVSITVISLVVAMAILFRGGSDDSGSGAGGNEQFGRLKVVWKIDEREGMFVMVDGKTLYDETKAPPETETFTLKLKPGKHDFRFDRDGYHTIRYSNKFIPGETIKVQLDWKSK